VDIIVTTSGPAQAHLRAVRRAERRKEWQRALDINFRRCSI